MTRLSIIVPVYKIPDVYLRICLDSLARISLLDIEIILVDDGSPDNCGSICDEYAAKDIRFRAIHTDNHGVSVARNTGIRASVGKWLTFVDGDDWIEPDLVEELLEEAESEDTDILFFSAYLNSNAEQKESHFSYGKKRVFERSDFEPLIRRVMTIYSFPIKKEEIFPLDGACGKIYSSDLIKKNNVWFPEGIPVSEDGLFFLYAIREARKIVYLDACAYHYRYNAESAMNKYRPEAESEQDKYLKKLREYVNTARDMCLGDTYNLRVLVSMRHCMEQKYFHPKNPAGYSNRRRAFIKLISNEPYKSALKTKKQFKASHFLFMRSVLIRMHFFEMLFILEKLKNLI